MIFRNLSKTFRYVNELGDSITFVFENGYLINKPKGIDTLTVSLSEAQGINQTGSTIQSRNVKSRPVTVSGIICGNVAANKKTLLSVVRPDLSGRLYADDYYLEVYPSATPTISAARDVANFQFSLLAPYPYWERDEDIDENLSGVRFAFRLADEFVYPAWLISQPFRFGEILESAFSTIINAGQTPVPFTITLISVGEVINPQVLEVLSGKYIKLNYTMSPGERVIVQITHSKTYVTSNLNGDIRGTLDLDSDFTRLAVGNNILAISADDGRNNLSVQIEHRTEITGIEL